MKDDGGQAFPIPDAIYPNGNVQPGANGMTLRDYFAAKAMQADLSQDGIEGRTVEVVAEMSYEMADAMLKVRSKP